MQNKFFPHWNVRTIRLYYLTALFMNFWVIAPIWYFMFRHFVTVKEIGLNEIIVFAIGLLAEVPSGALADHVGRRKVLIYGAVILFIGAVATTFAFNLLSLIIAQAIFLTGYAFYSGTNEALVYDKLKEEGRENIWHIVNANAKNISIVATIVAVLISGLLYSVHYRLPYAVYSIFILGFLITAIHYPKDRPDQRNTDSHSFSNYIRNLKLGMNELFRPQLRFLLVGVALFTSIYYVYDWGVLRPLILGYNDYEGTSAAFLSFIVHCLLFGMFVILPRIFGKKANQKQVLWGVLLATVCYGLFSFYLGFWITGILVILYTMLSQAVDWWTGLYINQHCESKNRATTLSTWEMFRKLPYILVVGIITNINSWWLGVFILVTAVLAFSSATYALTQHHKY